MKKFLCRLVNSCCGLRGWLYRIWNCAEYEKQPFKTLEYCIKSEKVANPHCWNTYPRTVMDTGEERPACEICS